jgi:uncharacterized RDD family membrane protein YckC
VDEQNENSEQEENTAAPSTEALAPESQESKPATTETGNVEYASFIERFLALLIDAIIFGVVFGVIFSIFQNLLPQSVANQIRFAYNPLVTLLMWAYFVYMDIKYGATLGKRVMHLKVQSLDTSENLTTIDAILRETIGKILSWLVFGLGYLWMLWDDKKQCWHDKLGKSVVVKVK